MKLDCPVLKTLAWILPLSRDGNTKWESPSKKNIQVSNVLLRTTEATHVLIVLLALCCAQKTVSSADKAKFNFVILCRWQNSVLSCVHFPERPRLLGRGRVAQGLHDWVARCFCLGQSSPLWLPRPMQSPALLPPNSSPATITSMHTAGCCSAEPSSTKTCRVREEY